MTDKRHKISLSIGPAICHALGLDPDVVTALDLHVSVEDVPTLTVTRFIRDDETEAMVEVLGRYELTLKDEP